MLLQAGFVAGLALIAFFVEVLVYGLGMAGLLGYGCRGSGNGDGLLFYFLYSSMGLLFMLLG